MKKKLLLALLITSILSGCSTTQPVVESQPAQLTTETIFYQEETQTESTQQSSEIESTQQSSEAPENFIAPTYSGSPFTVINDNVPYFSESDLSTTSYESYSSLDNLGRCGVCIANIGTDIMPTEERGEIGMIKPSGWHTVKYDCVNGKYLYNRCHLIGYQLSGENANEKNLITGTRYLNVEGMLPFENMVADYVKETNNHVLYRVTPIFTNNDLVAKGVLMEAESVKDNGSGIQFNVFCHNVQPGVAINYTTGESALLEGSTSLNEENIDEGFSVGAKEESVWVSPTGKKYHSNPTCSGMSSAKELTKDEAKSEGYEPCKKCYQAR